MSKYHVARSALVTQSSDAMYALVNDVAAYPQFLPWCGGAEILSREDGNENNRDGNENGDDRVDDGGENIITARVQIAYKNVSQSFTTRNLQQPPDRIVMELVDGPFSSLSGAWEFKSLRADACRISLDLRFAFANAVTGAVVGPVFKYIADSMVDSFVRRAEQLSEQSAQKSSPAKPDRLCVEVVYASLRRQVVEQVQLAHGATIRDAIAASTLPSQFPELDVATVSVGVFGTVCPPDWKLADNDRVEVYRPLTMRPTDARRRRAEKSRG